MNNDNEKPAGGDQRVCKKAYSYFNSANSQRQRILETLHEKHEGLTTIKIRKPPLDILAAAWHTLCVA
jgi:hypothetical protein